MQVDKKFYDPAQHDKFTALTVKQPYADLLTRVTWRDEDGNYHAAKTIEVRSRNTKFRGDLLICSSAKPIDPWGRHPAGVTCGFVELYDTKPVEEFTPEDWAATCIPEGQRPAKGWGWMMRNPRRVVEMPIKGNLGLYTLVMPKNDITPYPKRIMLGKEFFEKINGR